MPPFRLAGCGLNSVPTAEENVNAKWANVAERISAPHRPHSQPGRDGEGLCKAGKQRADRGHAGAGRCRAASSSAPSDLDDPAKVRAFNDAQNRLTQAIIPLQRLQEAYPELKSNQNFLTLQSQIEGTENSILVSRRDYNEAVQAYNTRIRTFPDAIGAKIFYGAKPKVPFEAAAGAQEAPKVDFNTAG